MISARLACNFSIINMHGPTEEKDEQEKDSFYQTLTELYDKCPRHDIKIIIRDANAQVGKEDEFCVIVGKNGVHNVTNDNGERLINFAVSRNVIIGSTMFKHRNIHLVTWSSPDKLHFNQNEHVLIDKRHASNLMHVRTYRGANIDSDHYLVLSRVRARISNSKKRTKVLKHLNLIVINLRILILHLTI